VIDVYRYRSPFGWAEYRLTDEGVLVTEKKLLRLTRALVAYDELPVHATQVTQASKGFFWTAVVGGLLFLVIAVNLALRQDVEPAALLVYGVVCGIGIAGYLLTRRIAIVFFHGGNHLTVYVRPADMEAPQAFIEAMQAYKIEFLKQRLQRRAPDVTLWETLRYLVALRESGLLDEPGFVALRAHAESLAPDSGPSGSPA